MIELAAIIIAQNAGASGAIVTWSIGLIFLVLLLLATVAWLRKRLSPTREAGPIGFSLSDLRSLRQKGAISQEEFERAKAKIVQGFKPADSAAGKPGNLGPNPASAPHGRPEKS